MQALEHWQAFLDTTANKPINEAIRDLGCTLYTLRFKCEETSAVIEAERALLRTAEALGVGALVEDRAAVEEHRANGGEW